MNSTSEAIFPLFKSTLVQKAQTFIFKIVRMYQKLLFINYCIYPFKKN